MLYPIIVLLLVPLMLARSPVKQDDHLAHLFDLTSRSLLADLHMDHDVPVSSEPDTTARWTSGYKMKSTDRDTCRLKRGVYDRSNGAIGLFYICGSRSIPAIGFDCFQACEMDRKANINICMQVCPRPRASSIKPFVSGTQHLNQDSLLPLHKLLVDRTSTLRGREYKIGMFGVNKCNSLCIKDESGYLTGCLYECRSHDLPKIKPSCIYACEFKKKDNRNVCIVVCPVRDFHGPQL